MMYNVAYVTAGTSLRTLIPMLFRNGVGLRPACVIRCFYILLFGVSLLFLEIVSAVYRLLFVRRRMLRGDPIFIVGHWRCGSTYLHQLLAEDSNLAAPTTLLCTSPPAFPLSRIVLWPFMMIIGRGKRPMDNVLIDPRTPQEDEFALFRLTGFSPLKGLAYPRSDGRYFLSMDETFMPSDEASISRWQASLKWFALLVQGRKNLRPVFKNPCHSLRIDLLQKMFPDAAFIHLRRNPKDVIPSTSHMWSLIGPSNTLRGTWRNPSMEEVIEVYNLIERRTKEQLENVPDGRKIEVSFEDIEKNPKAVLRSIYEQLGMAVSPVLEQRWDRLVRRSKSYQKNRRFLSPEDEALISSRAVF